ncbi:MAG: fused MFS/spermidine synthase [Bryobacterales bacterium]|nr:fused MFS/spermidine synthase [Bryobacterales bacterium]
MFLYALTIFLSAFLLFQVQPLIAKIILPWFGGSAAVWSAAMLFFQVSLLAGYAYAHFLIRNFKARAQMQVHGALLVISAALLPILPNPYWKPTQAGDPTLRILLLLAATIGLPYFLLSSTSPLLQAWYVRRSGSSMPYRLFALSNFGSMLGLITFPFWVEPALASRAQAYIWSGIYVAFAILCGLTAWVSQTPSKAAEAAGVFTASSRVTPRPAFKELVFWVALAACASILLVSITNHLSQNVAPIPLLWVIPLALYLLSFILCFESDKIYQRWIFVPLLAALLGFMAYYLFADSGNTHIKQLIPLFAAGLFVCCMVCHGELSRRKPAADHLTLFYLMVSLGGALGGVTVALVAPHVFNSYLELPAGMALCALLTVIALWDIDMPKFAGWALGAMFCLGFGAAVAYLAGIYFPGRLGPLAVRVTIGMALFATIGYLWLANNKFPKLDAWPLRVALCIGLGALSGYLVRHHWEEQKTQRLSVRNFYGVLKIHDDDPSERDAERSLTHGTINHGSQLLAPELRYVTTSYYGENSGIGRAIRAIHEKGPARIGSIGLGAAVISNYGKLGDYLRIYEINPLVEGIAQTWFTFYPHSQADKKILMGDARLTLENQLKAGDIQNFDVLSVDAFSSDAIPIHLLTREALDLYFHHLKPNGILALHISNRYLDLAPVCASGAAYFHKDARTINDDGALASYFSSSTWVLVTSDPSWFLTNSFADADISKTKFPANFRAWTDDYSNIIQILRLN